MESNISINGMQKLTTLLQAARQRNGFGSSAQTNKVKKIVSTSDFLKGLRKITTNIVKQEANPKRKRIVKPAVFPRVERNAGVRPKKTLGNYIDVMV